MKISIPTHFDGTIDHHSMNLASTNQSTNMFMT